jgi:hypothetical protein
VTRVLVGPRSAMGRARAPTLHWVGKSPLSGMTDRRVGSGFVALAPPCVEQRASNIKIARYT